MQNNHKWQIGTIISIDNLLDDGIEKLLSMKMDTYQLGMGESYYFNDEQIAKVKKAVGSFIPSTAILGWPAPAVWDFIEGPITLGLRPIQYRKERIECYLRGLDVVHELGIPMITSHIGFVPEDPNQQDYKDMVIALREIALYAKKLNIEFCLETGQETPITLKRIIQDAGVDNIGINLDPANLLMYGKANPVDSIDIFGEYVKSLHIKDGQYPTNANELGDEVPVGEGLTNFPLLLKKLDDIGFDGPLIIEREISGDKQTLDIINAYNLLEKWMSELD